jgi:hypothetical protein
VLDLINFLDPFFVKNIASDPVGGIRGVGNDSSLLERFHHSMDEPGLRIFRIDVQDHTSPPDKSLHKKLTKTGTFNRYVLDEALPILYHFQTDRISPSSWSTFTILRFDETSSPSKKISQALDPAQ